MTPVGQLKNIGPTTAGWLNEIGVSTREDLERMGPVMLYHILRHQRPEKVNLLFLYAIYGALHDLHWQLPKDVKARLREEAEGELQVSFELSRTPDAAPFSPRGRASRAQTRR